MAAMVGRARSCAQSCAVVLGHACVVVHGHAWSCMHGRARSCVCYRSCVVVRVPSCVGGRGRACALSSVVVRSCRSARFAASTAVARTNERTTYNNPLNPPGWGGSIFFLR